MRSPYFETIKQLSGQLLNAQIEVLNPDYIIFANGIANARYRREFFSVPGSDRCTLGRAPRTGISTRFLWEFVLDGRTRCFRVHHPSARSRDAQKGREGALLVLAEAVGRKPS